MRKVFILLILMVLSSCSNSLDKEAYISSYYIDYKDDMYSVYFNLLDNEDHKLGEFHSENLSMCFSKVMSSIDMNINFSYVKSVILNERMLNKKCIDDFTNLIKGSNYLGFNFYVFISSFLANTIYNSKKIIETEYYYALYNNPTNDNLYLSYRPIHFLEFSRKYYDNFDSLVIPSINVLYDWNDTNKNSNVVSLGIYNVNRNYVDINDNIGASFFKKSKKIVIGNNNITIEIADYKLKIDKNLNLTLSGKIINNNEKGLEFINSKLTEYINLCYQNEIDILNIKGINYRYKKNYTLSDLKIIYKFKC